MSDPLRVGLVSPYETDFDPRVGADFFNQFLNWQVYESPLRPTADGSSAEAALLDGLPRPLSGGERPEWWARVRPGVFFSDGTELTASYLVDSLARAPTFAQEAEIDLDGDRILFRARRPTASLDWLLTHHGCAVVAQTPQGYVGTGPYVPDNKDGRASRLTRNPHHAEKPPIEEIALSVYPADSEGQMTALIDAVNGGEVDLTLALGRDDLRRVNGVHKWMGQGKSVCYLYFNAERPFVRRASVRRALAKALDRRVLASVSYDSPLAFAATGFLPVAVGVMPDGLRPDPAGARRELAEADARSAGPAGPLTFLVIPVARPYLPHPRATAEKLVEQMAEIGVEVKIEMPSDVKEYLHRTSVGDYDLAIAGWIPDTPDLPSYFESLLASKAVPTDTQTALVSSNIARYRSAEMDTLLEEYRQHQDATHLNRINSLLDAERPLVALLYGAEIVVTAWRVRGRPTLFHSRPFIAEMAL